MAEFENNAGIMGKSKGKTAHNSMFNRSLTIHASSMTKPYLQSTSKFLHSFDSMKGKVKKLRHLFETPRASAKPKPNESPQSQLMISQSHKFKSMKSMGPEYHRSSISISSSIRLPGTADRIVVYFTSLHGVRRTFEDCYSVRMIFKGFRVWVDERDVSMDCAYKKELLDVLGQKKNVSLPQVFIRGNYYGGAEVIKLMFETGELARALAGFPRRQPGFVCQGCGDVRFVPCGNCSGSRKVFDEDEGVAKRCLECNENGLIRCPDCC